MTLVSPCPEKGLSIFLRLAETLPEVQFLAVKTPTWTKPWHEQILKKYKNVKVQAATDRIDDVLKACPDKQHASRRGDSLDSHLPCKTDSSIPRKQPDSAPFPA